MRVTMQELGLAGHSSIVGGLSKPVNVPAKANLLARATSLGIVFTNETEHPVEFQIPCQALSKIARDLIEIARPGPTDLEFLKSVANMIYDEIKRKHRDELASIRVCVARIFVEGTNFRFSSIYFCAD